MYDSLLGISDALHLDAFDQPALELLFGIVCTALKCPIWQGAEKRPSTEREKIPPGLPLKKGGDRIIQGA
jgi:hypothetical protein